MSALLEVENLVKHFGPVVAVDGVSLSVGRGEVLGFLGPNGAGKSTAMKMATGYLRPDAGRVLIDGTDMETAPIAAKARIGYLPEGAPSWDEMTPRGFLRFIAAARGLRGKAAQAAVELAVDRANIGSVLHRPIGHLSKGFRRRVGLAQAILHDPEILILDEPTDGLDPNQKHDVRELIRAMASEKAIVISTHLLEEVEAVCSRALIIDRGRIVADGTPGELLARSPHHNAVSLVVEPADAGAIEAALAGMEGVQRVEQNPAGENRIRLSAVPESGREILSAIGDAARKKGWNVEMLYAEPGRLDEVFRAITTADAPHHRTARKEESAA